MGRGAAAQEKHCRKGRADLEARSPKVSSQILHKKGNRKKKKSIKLARHGNNAGGEPEARTQRHKLRGTEYRY